MWGRRVRHEQTRTLGLKKAIGRLSCFGGVMIGIS